jgi:hypothetical protein
MEDSILKLITIGYSFRYSHLWYQMAYLEDIKGTSNEAIDYRKKMKEYREEKNNG